MSVNESCDLSRKEQGKHSFYMTGAVEPSPNHKLLGELTMKLVVSWMTCVRTDDSVLVEIVRCKNMCYHLSNSSMCCSLRVRSGFASSLCAAYSEDTVGGEKFTLRVKVQLRPLVLLFVLIATLLIAWMQ
jgi:hypothetical protein